MIVVDASVVYKWIVDEEGGDTRSARKLRDDYLSGKIQVTAPDILLYEIANIFAYKTHLAAHDALRAWKSFLLLEIPVTSATLPFIAEALKYSQKYGISVYDASYIALAKKRNCSFVTADTKLVSRVSLSFVQSISS